MYVKILVILATAGVKRKVRDRFTKWGWEGAVLLWIARLELSPGQFRVQSQT